MNEPMQKEYAKLRRRPFLMPLGVPVAFVLAFLAVLAWGVLSASTTTIYVIRHAEPSAAGEAAGRSLSLAGELRAQRLSQVFAGGSGRLALDGVLVSDARPTQDTARPVANALGIPVIVLPGADADDVAGRALGEFRGGRLLVIADREQLPAIVQALSGEAVPEVPETEFGALFVIARPRYSPPSVSRLTLP